jgi:chemotaxis protein methyltransferase CheR
VSFHALPELGPLEYELFRRLIRDSFGLDYPPQRKELLGLRLAKRLQSLGLRRYSEYHHRLFYANRADAEWQAFADAVTNNETYFFRESHQFSELASLGPTLAASTHAPLRALSAGCSSGEEAYGIAMTLSASGIFRDCEIVGVDLNSMKLEEATEGRYSEKSFRPSAEAPAAVDVKRCFLRPDGAFVVAPWLKKRVSFARVNLVDPKDVARLGEFDIAFCRNVLIYAHEESFPRFVSALEGLLRPGGYLFLGHSESLSGWKGALRAQRLGVCTAYVREPD